MAAVTDGAGVVVVGAGPAGVRAAETLHAFGCPVTLVHEGPSGGGNIYRRQPAGFARSAPELYGSEAGKAEAIHSAYDALRSRIEILPHTTVLNVQANQLLLNGADGLSLRGYENLLVATGAMDRILPLPGWTLPGVYTLGGSQIALKHQACAIGNSVVFFGTGPLLYLVASQYVKAGADVRGVFDTSSWRTKAGQAFALARGPRMLWLGTGFRNGLRRAGVPIREGITPLEIRGTTRVEGFAYRTAAGETELVGCDAVGFGYGLKPESQVAEIAGARLRFDPAQRVWTIVHDGEGRAGKGLYVAGDGAAIAGADAAELSGRLAALSLLGDLGIAVTPSRIAPLKRKLRSLAKIRAALDAAFPVPVQNLRAVPDRTILCRCETVTFGDARAAIHRYETGNVNQLKATCRAGMGRCQGRVCGLVAAELLASETGRPIEAVGPLRGQAPIKPVSYSQAKALAEPKIAAAVAAVFGAAAE